ncbi:hypothetical protein NDN08_002924 [Rhodosorus marinus]|uniref:Deoxynucleoside kinase domain-containing protein n=1 Tax=Rhodosorus marinus TaxID=101924 RepID=A0AAV8V0V5_9RHOD|nr:hypothetical protein NDN08_002924 [Rhodosorus marinus]
MEDNVSRKEDGLNFGLSGLSIEDQESLLKLHNEVAWFTLDNEQAGEFADSLLGTTGPPKPDLKYIRTVFGEDRVLKWIRTETFRKLETDDASMITSPEQGDLLRLLIQATGAEKVLDVGTFTGYSSTCMAMTSERISVTTMDCEEGAPQLVAREAWKRAGVESQINFIAGDALSSMKTMRKESFDLVFIDADKERYEEYYEVALDLVRDGGVVIIDDSLWSGRLSDPTVQDPSTNAIRRANLRISGDLSVESALVPIHDGMTVAVKRREHPVSSTAFAGHVVSVEGNIAVGKTTLLNTISRDPELSGEVPVQIFYENPTESFLKLFYEDPERYGFGFQIHMLQTCQNLVNSAGEHAQKAGLSFVDRSPWGNSCFADCNYRLGRLSEDEYAVYRTMLNSQPLGLDVLVYLDVPPEISLARCVQRGVNAEAAVELDYLERLDSSHFEMLCETIISKRLPVLVIDWRSFAPIKMVLEQIYNFFKHDQEPARLRNERGSKDSLALGAEEIIELERSLKVDGRLDLQDIVNPTRIQRIPTGTGPVYASFKRLVLYLLANKYEVVFEADST